MKNLAAASFPRFSSHRPTRRTFFEACVDDFRVAIYEVNGTILLWKLCTKLVNLACKDREYS
jgi:hypothetical protein